MSENVVYDQSKAFALRIINLYKYLRDEKHEHVMSKQVLRSGTSIGANVAESQYGVSKAEFVLKLRIALREANETKYWIELLNASGYIEQNIAESLISDCNSIIYLLISIIRTSSPDR